MVFFLQPKRVRAPCLRPVSGELTSLPFTIHGIKNCDAMKKARAWLTIQKDNGRSGKRKKIGHAELRLATLKGVNRVVHDITSKPPGTIEWK
jgi:GMP synthase PP-ATPase subunit